jgi:hypothetical protein
MVSDGGSGGTAGDGTAGGAGDPAEAVRVGSGVESPVEAPFDGAQDTDVSEDAARARGHRRDTDEQLAAAIRRLRASGERFVVQLRRDEGFDSDALDELCEAIDTCGRSWAASPTVPKAAALILAGLFPAIDGCAWLYPDPMRQRILEAAARVAQGVSASLDTPDVGLDYSL